MGDEKNKKGAIEVLPPEKPDPLNKTLMTPAAFPLIDKFNKRRVEAFTEVVKAETGLMHAIGDHAKTKERLRDIDIELETERLQRRNELADQRRKALLAGDNFNLEKKDIELKLARIAAELAALKKPPEPLKSEAETRADKLKEQEERQKFEIEKEILEKKKTVLMWGRIDEEKEQAKQEALIAILKRYKVTGMENLPPAGLRELAKKYEAIDGHFEDMKAED